MAIVGGIPRSVRPGVGIKGMDIVLSNLNREILKIKGRSLKGLIEASIIVHRDMDKTAPTIPIDLGNLRQSRFTVTAKGVEDGRSPNFKGENATEMASEHSSTIAETRSLAQAASAQGPVLMMGFSANYAMWVHEMLGANFRQPKKGARRGSPGAKFFEASLKRNKALTLETIRINVKIK